MKMKTLAFEIQIKTTKEKVWNALWDDKSYRSWTSVFSEGSHVITDWKEGQKILFLNGEGQGMYSVIEKNIPFEFMSFRHLGEISNGKEIPSQTMGTTENYTLTSSDDGTKLLVEVEIEEEYQSYFKETFPKALEKLKAIAEA